MAKWKTLIVRRRGLIFKLLLGIPCVWLVVSLVTLSDHPDKGADSHNVFKDKSEHLRHLDGVDSIAKKHQKEAKEKEIQENGAQDVQVEIPKPPPPPQDDVEQHQAEEQKKQPSKPHEIHYQRGVLLPPQEPNGPGEMGKPVVLPKDLDAETKKKVDEGWQKNAFNQYVSDMISVHRTLPDPRDEWCKAPGRFLDNLPATSVIVCFHNEAWSVLLRTVHSILDRSPSHLLHEIILVDDDSDMPHLKEQLEDYMAQYPKVKIVRLQKREGLIRARLMGAKQATAPVLTFLDSHCECTTGWLEPLLDPIARNSSTVATPVIDVITDDTLEFKYQLNSGSVSVGGFDWSLQAG